MRKFLIGLLAAAAMTAPALSAEVKIFDDEVKGWQVFGSVYNGSSGACFVSKYYTDGSHFSVVLGIDDGVKDVNVIVKNVRWEIAAPVGRLEDEVELRFYEKNEKVLGSGKVTAEVLDKNQIFVGPLTGQFLVDLGKAHEIQFLFKIDGLTTDNAFPVIPLAGSTAALMRALDCMDILKEELE